VDAICRAAEFEPEMSALNLLGIVLTGADDASRNKARSFLTGEGTAFRRLAKTQTMNG